LLYADSWIQTAYGTITGPPSDSTIQTGATLTQIETNKNILGVNQTVYPSVKVYNEYLLGTRIADEKKEQSCLHTKFFPEPSITITREETANPLDLAVYYVGKANLAGWHLRPEDPAHSWLCTSITGSSSDNGVTYQVTYSFMRRLAYLGNGTTVGYDWHTHKYWIDPKNNTVPDDASTAPDALNAGSTNSGEVIITDYEEVDFNGLELS